MSTGILSEPGAFQDVNCFKAMIILETKVGSKSDCLNRSCGKAVMTSSKIVDPLFSSAWKGLPTVPVCKFSLSGE